MSSPLPRLILASNSPRRRELLAQAGFLFTSDPAHVDERILPGETPARFVGRLALAKAAHVAARYTGGIVLGADTVVVAGDRLFGKPSSEDDARDMLASLSGRTHTVITGVALVDAATGKTVTHVESTEVRFGILDPGEIDEYVSSGEPMDKAGAYAIQGRGAVFVEGISGCFFNVVGLPLAALGRMLDTFKDKG